MTIRLTLAIVMLAAGITSAVADVRIGQGAKLKDQAIACPTIAALMNIMRETDQWKAGMQAVADKCAVISKGEMVRVSQNPGDFTCFTTQTHRGNCLWVPTDFVIPID